MIACIDFEQVSSTVFLFVFWGSLMWIIGKGIRIDGDRRA